MPIHPWRECEIALTAERDYSGPYADVEVWAEFTHEGGSTLRRPAFWDGGRIAESALCLAARRGPLELA